jgi:hypothetical protein
MFITGEASTNNKWLKIVSVTPAVSGLAAGTGWVVALYGNHRENMTDGGLRLWKIKVAPVYKKSFLSALICLSLAFSFPTRGDEGSLIIAGAKDHSLVLSGWDKSHGGWSDIEYASPVGKFKLYKLPLKAPETDQGAVVTYNGSMISPDKKRVMLQRTAFMLVEDEQGTASNSEQTFCDAISLDTGCVEYTGSAEQCDGEWEGTNWKVREGGKLDFSKGLIAPPKLRRDVAQISENDARVDALIDRFFPGVSSYMACYPPESNVVTYNDLGFYFAQGGEHHIALEIYRRLLSVAPDRVVLLLNTADSLWELGRLDEARSYYKSYGSAMIKDDKGGMVPQRVGDRVKK